MASTKEKLEDLNLSHDEIGRLTKAFQNEEFRKMFKDYAEEIADPENRRRYEEEITAMEKERGMNVEFVNPDPGYVVKTTVDGETKAFINVCKSDKIEKPSTKRDIGLNGKLGLAWSIPHSLAPPRDDMDKKNGKCKVYDFVVHPDTYRMAETNDRFREMINSTAYDAIEKQFSVQLDRKNAKFLKMKFKGTATPTVIRTKSGEPKVLTDSKPDDILNSFPYPYDDKTTKEKSEIHEAEAANRAAAKLTNGQTLTNGQGEDGEYTTPKFGIKHRSEVDFQDFRDARDANTSTRPKELVVEIDLPLILRASQVELDIFEKQLNLQSEKPAKYKLSMTLPYAVNENEGSAKFDKAKRKLVVTLPVLPGSIPDISTIENGINEIISSSSISADAQETEPLNQEVENSVNGAAMNGHLERTPLIEELSTSETQEESKEIVTSAKPEELMQKVHAPREVAPTLVDFDHHQSDESIVFVLHAGRVDRPSVKLTFPDGNNSVNIKMTSVGSGGFPIHYTLYAKFPSDCAFETENCRADVDPQNVVVVLVKSDGSMGHWDRFQAGIDADHMEELFFLTRSNLQTQLYDLSPEEGTTSLHGAPDLEVTEMDGEKLVVSIKEQKCTSRRKKHLSESADDIEVIHDREVPSELKPIIKQLSRTTSESSEDPLSSSYGRQGSTTSFNGSESSLAESDENPDCSSGRKKTVSFSEHIDKTTYKSNQSVSSMRSTLRNKRKKHRQAERRLQDKQQRRRRKSSGSEGPSSDDNGSIEPRMSNTINGNAVEPQSPGYDMEGDDEASPSVEKSSKLRFDQDWPEPGSEEPCIESEDTGSVNEQTNTISNDSSTPENQETCKSPSDMAPEHAEWTDTDSLKAKAGSNDNPNEAASDTPSKEVDAEIPGNKPKASLIQELDPESSRNREGVLEAKGDPDPNAKTVLDWEDGKSAEHGTSCAFSFSNNVMFDLDVD